MHFSQPCFIMDCKNMKLPTFIQTLLLWRQESITSTDNLSTEETKHKRITLFLTEVDVMVSP